MLFELAQLCTSTCVRFAASEDNDGSEKLGRYHYQWCVRPNMTSTVDEKRSVKSSKNIDRSEGPRSLRWRVGQGVPYVIGSLCFTVGSCMYFTDLFRKHPAALTVGGWLFTIGSSLYLIADLQDWWDYRTGYCFNRPYLPLVDNDTFASRSPSDSNAPASIELNVYGSACSAALYLAGSILFIPLFNDYLSMAEWFFILGSTFGYLSSIWKIYRSASAGSCRLSNLFNNGSAFITDSVSCLGNLCFFIGTILFLPYVSRTDAESNHAAILFVFGSSCFVCSSLVFQYKLCRSSSR